VLRSAVASYERGNANNFEPFHYVFLRTCACFQKFHKSTCASATLARCHMRKKKGERGDWEIM